MKNKEFIQELWDNYKMYNMWVTEISQGKGRYKGTKAIFEGRITKNSPKLSSNMNHRFRELRTSNTINAKKKTK